MARAAGYRRGQGPLLRHLGRALDVEEDEAAQQRVEHEDRADGQVDEEALEEGVPAGLVGHAAEAQASHLRGRGLARDAGHVVHGDLAGRGDPTGAPLERRGVPVVRRLEALVGPVAAGASGIVARLLLHSLAALFVLLLVVVVVVVRLVVVVVVVVVVVAAGCGEASALLAGRVVPAADGPLVVDGLLLVVEVDDEERGEADVTGAGAVRARLGQIHRVLEEGDALLALPANRARSLSRREGQ